MNSPKATNTEYKIPAIPDKTKATIIGGLRPNFSISHGAPQAGISTSAPSK